MIDEKQQLQELPCIIYDEYMYFAEQVAHLLKLPSIILSTGSAANLLTYYAFPRLQKDGFIPFEGTVAQLLLLALLRLGDQAIYSINCNQEDDMALDMVPELHPFRFRDLPAVASSENLDALLKLMASAHDTRSSSAMILNSMEFLEQSSLIQLKQQCRIPVFSIGPLHKTAPAPSSSLVKEEASCMAWLDKQALNSVIYVSLGSIVSMDEKELTEMAWALANSKQPFLWVLKRGPPGSFHGSESTDSLPNGFKETIGNRGYIVNWATAKKGC
ncbi:hypothetical protein Patl1_31214 [Pistacia atlantica]|uniref:Uncharacterized protein n=1 Tax=Pistacia atlantica TaxID=434234 RepID=A0ACC1AAZ6_9ROSI|nr:hypothetical protein Patl1_31214 [Pistacia atlantica]